MFTLDLDEVTALCDLTADVNKALRRSRVHNKRTPLQLRPDEVLMILTLPGETASQQYRQPASKPGPVAHKNSRENAGIID